MMRLGNQSHGLWVLTMTYYDQVVYPYFCVSVFPLLMLEGLRQGEYYHSYPGQGTFNEFVTTSIDIIVGAQYAVIVLMVRIMKSSRWMNYKPSLIFQVQKIRRWVSSQHLKRIDVEE